MDYSNICYKRSCISQVIIRLDFSDFLESKILFSDSVEKIIIPNFPQKGMQQLIRFQTMNVMFDDSDAKTEKTARDGLQQEFANSEGNKVVLSNKFIVLELNKYTKYEEVNEKFIPILRTIMDEIDVTVVRTGIRYINEFGKDGIKPQKGYFNNPTLALADSKTFSNESIHPIRVMALNEYNVGDMKLNFRYGQYNQQYPQPIKQMNFVLDYDCFCEEPLHGLESIITHIEKGHDAIQILFENTITDKLRKVMKGE